MDAATTGRIDAADDVIALIDPLRRIAAARLTNRHDVDDVVQETLTRVLAAHHRLDDASLLAYAIVVVRNLIASQHRDRERARQNAPRLIDLTSPTRPDESLLAEEERLALAEALSRLPDQQREDLVAHVVHERPLTDVSAGRRASPQAAAAQLSRTRARVRLDYVLALRKVELPTPQCRPVLLALSAGDHRRQRATGAHRHLLTCQTCAEVSPPLLSRERALAGVAPWAAAGLLWDRFLWLMQRPKAQVATTGAVTAAGVLAGAIFLTPAAEQPGRPAPMASPRNLAPVAGMLATRERSLLPVPGDLRRLAGESVRARQVRVLSVPADEGFWVGRSPGERVWVQLNRRAESGRVVRAGQLASFTGRLRAHGPAFPDRVGVAADEGGRQLARQGAHIRVARAELEIDRG